MPGERVDGLEPFAHCVCFTRGLQVLIVAAGRAGVSLVVPVAQRSGLTCTLIEIPVTALRVAFLLFGKPLAHWTIGASGTIAKKNAVASASVAGDVPDTLGILLAGHSGLVGKNAFLAACRRCIHEAGWLLAQPLTTADL